MKDDKLQCSVIVPVYNQWDLVPKLIGCLDSQSLGQKAFELLLIDNGSSQLPDPVGLPPFARLLHCQEPGSYAARNQGIKHARGAYLVFTDADCLPSSQWLEQGLQCIKHADRPHHTIVAGGIQMVPFNDNSINAYELYDMTLGLLQEHYVRMGYGTTANLFFAKSIINRVGCFEQSRYSGGDAEFCRRASQYGVEMYYCAAALVYHPARASWQELAHKARRIKGGKSCMAICGDGCHLYHAPLYRPYGHGAGYSRPGR
ncbi:MAG: glycosyltransferase [Gammaproteobacteria bacterium]|nr:glycosyltransferase [Gammaproteobacteria bacterium]